MDETKFERLNKMLEELNDADKATVINVLGIDYMVVSIGTTIEYKGDKDIDDLTLPQTATLVYTEPIQDLQYSNECWFVFKYAHMRNLIFQIEAEYAMK